MEILAVVEDTSVYVAAIVLTILVALVGFTVGIILLKDKEKSGDQVGGGINVILIGVIALFGTISIFRGEVPTTYKAVVTDFNEVYNNGYKIIDQEGELYILEKVD